MKIVIDISENDYWLACNHPEVLIGVYAQAIKNGTPLPKVHGRLIDVDETIKTICGKSCGCELEECGYDVPCYSVTRINSAPTIIEADKEGEQE